MAERTYLLNMMALEHARIDKGMSKRKMTEQLGWQAASFSNLLSRARRGKPIRLSTIVALAWVLGVDPMSLTLEQAMGCVIETT